MKMIVVFSDRIPPAVRGKMKLWFIEPSPNVFISSVSDALAQRVCDKLFESCKDDSSLISDVAAGSVILHVGDRLTPGAIGMAASIGRAYVTVFRKLRVGVFFSGDELV